MYDCIWVVLGGRLELVFATGAVEGVTRQAPLQYNLSQVVSVEQGISHTERRLFSWLNVVSHGNGIISFIPFLLPPDYNVFIVTYVVTFNSPVRSSNKKASTN